MSIKTSNTSWLRYGLAVIIFCLCSILTISAFKATHTFETQRVANETERLIHSQMASLQRSFDLMLESIHSMGAYIGASNLIRQQGFKQYAKKMRQSRQGIDTVAWVPQVLNIEQRIFLNTIKKQLDDFNMMEFANNGEIVPISQRERYFPLTYEEPAASLNEIIGLDMGSHPDWLRTMEQGRDKGIPVATKAFPYDTKKNMYIGIFQPVYHSGLPNKLAARRANIRGFIFVTINLNNIIKQSLESLIAQKFSLEITDSESSEITTTQNHTTESTVLQAIQYWLSLSLPESSNNFITDLNVVGQNWALILTPTDEFTIAQSAWAVLIGGTVLTLLLVFYLLILMGRTARIERLVAERTFELEESEAHLVQSEKMASIGQMVAGIVHEINTPLAYVKSSVELTKSHIDEIAEALQTYEEICKQDNVTTEQLQTAQDMSKTLEEDETLEEAQLLLDNGLSGIDKISNLVRNLKDFSRLDRAEAAEHDVNKGLDDALNMINHMLEDKVKINKNYADIPHIMCSPAQINQVFLNLLVNAIHAIHADKDNGVIDITTSKHGQHVEVMIKDDGKGIPPENLSRIFEPFFTTKRSGKGTGLGLAITNKIIKEHKGELRVASKVGQGTAFTIYLPFE
ncbi:CHASE domain-containing protein [Candidatus Halobeggiatoa sp. HSG11]|nr:CHASE domain-containing protein [Candidatus Halobeggiatoa sp. HSG11]